MNGCWFDFALATIQMPFVKLGGELNCSGFKQIDECSLNMTSTHGNALTRWHAPQCMDCLGVPLPRKLNHGIDQAE